MSLYNKMRPKTLNDVKGQDKITAVLKDCFEKKNIPNAFLFVGTRGVGKTSVAKITARMMNCLNPAEDGSPCNECAACRQILAGSSLDVIELDAASNNGVDNIRELIQNVQYKPLFKYKVVILDEVHMLSQGAFNALLKILEEPPKKVHFILCTTEFHKVPATIVSRCRKLVFESIPVDVITEKLELITKTMGKEAEKEALEIVARAANGSLRDAESIFESFIISDEPITAQRVRDILGYTSQETAFAILDGIAGGNPSVSIAALQEVKESGESLSFLLEECLRILLDAAAVKCGESLSDISSSETYVEKISEYAFSFETARLIEIADAFRQVYENKSGNTCLAFEASLYSLFCQQSIITDLQNRISLLEEKLENAGAFSAVSADAALEEPPAIEEPEAGPSAVAEEETDTAMFSEEELDDSMLEPSQEESLGTSVQENCATSPSANISRISDAQLASLGFTVIQTNPEEHESADGLSRAETYAPEIEEQFPEETEAEASTFDDFARLFSGM